MGNLDYLTACSCTLGTTVDIVEQTSRVLVISGKRRDSSIALRLPVLRSKEDVRPLSWLSGRRRSWRFLRKREEFCNRKFPVAIGINPGRRCDRLQVSKCNAPVDIDKVIKGRFWQSEAIPLVRSDASIVVLIDVGEETSNVERFRRSVWRFGRGLCNGVYACGDANCQKHNFNADFHKILIAVLAVRKEGFVETGSSFRRYWLFAFCLTRRQACESLDGNRIHLRM